ncbi:MAG: LysM peptidoglycan-binding domain-containing protein [Pseudomonadota bacterium]
MAIAFLKLGAQLLAGTAAASTVAVATGVVKLETVTGWFDAVNQTPQIVAKLATPEKPKSAAPLGKAVEKPAAEKTEPAPKPLEPQVREQPKPKFDVLRVEKDGSVVVAGNGPGDALVQMLLPDGTVVGETKSGPEGDFVIVPDKNLPAGDHVLTLQAMREGSDEKISSAQSSVVHIPGKEDETEVLAMITEEGAASRIVAKPKALQAPSPLVAAVEPKAPAKPQSKSEAAVVKAEPVLTASKPNPQSKPAKLAPKPKSEPKVQNTHPQVAKAKPDIEPKPEPIAKATPKPSADPTPAPVVVEAVEVEGEKVFVAGAVKRGTPVRVYINNKSLGVTKGTVDDRFLIAKNFNLNSGEHTVRADVLDRKTGNVSARAEVPLVHETLEETAQPTAETPTVPAPQPVQTTASIESPKPQTVASIKPVASVEATTQQQAVVTTNPIAIPQAVAKNVEIQGPEQATVIRTGRAVIIKPGDNLWRISRKTYGRGIRYTTIYNANRDQIRDPSRIYIGQIFKIPEKYTQ